MEHYDLFVIGAGPGGYVAAIRAAKLGMKTAVAERGQVGGTCLNRGCIPTKALLHAAQVYRDVKDCARFGVTAEAVGYDMKSVYEYKEESVKQLREGVRSLLEQNGVTLYRGSACLHKDRRISIAGEEGETVCCTASHVLLAAGSAPAKIRIPGAGLAEVVSSDDLLREPPEGTRLVIIGGGVIGVEFATVFASYGWEISIVEAEAQLLPAMDREISQNLKMILKKRGITSYTDSSVEEISKDEESGECICRLTSKGKALDLYADRVLIAVGRSACLTGLTDEDVEIAADRGRILVDDHFKTSLDGVYAIGDVIPGMQLAHLASAQGIAAVEDMCGVPRSVDVNLVPSCVYTDPEIACVGLTEEEAKKSGREVMCGKFVMSANGKSLLTKQERGFIKLVFEKDTEILLGAQLMCARATDMIGELALAVENGLDYADLVKVMRAHPTFYEAVTEAAESAKGEAIHIAPPRKRR